MAQTTGNHSKRTLGITLSALMIVALVFGFFGPGIVQAWGLVPITSIVSINPGVSVTVSGVNFPVNQVFTVRMGPYGSYGIGGTVVGSYDTTSGTSFTTTYAIPAALAGLDKIAIRLESSSGYFSYNWFYNTGSPAATPLPSGPTPVPGYSGYPTFSITSVAAGSSVTLQAYNMPVGQSFTVRMNYYGTLGIGGEVVGSTPSTGGSYSLTFSIPAWLAGQSKIAIRMDGPDNYYYAFNWFFNNTTSSAPAPTAVSTSVPGPTPIPGYYGYPTISISGVVKDATVTIYGYNFPAGQTFNVRMGAYGTLGIGGILVTTVDTGAGGSFSATYTIPTALAGSAKIAIRLDSTSSYYYAFNWFYNTTTY